jgi:anthranilate synthase component 2
MNILIFDNLDSFTYNLFHLVKALGYKNVEVHRNNRIELDAVERFDKIILSPGPGIPSESANLLPLIRRFAPSKSILGVCLGHQAIAEVFNGRLINLENVYHGVATQVRVVAHHRIFNGLPEMFEAGRYHSWIVDTNGFPDELEVTAVDEKGQIMALRHRTWDVNGVQFHPESVLTPLGKTIVEQFLNQ